MSQLTAIRYYEEEDKGDVIRKTHFYYRPYIYKYINKPYFGRVKDYYEKDVLKSEGDMKNGFPEGYWIYYNSNGSTKSKGNYKDGVKDSIWYSYYNDGTLKSIESYHLSNDTLHSDTLNAWYYDGRKVIETTGDTVRRYYPSGRLMAKTIKGENKLQEVYLADGTVVFRSDSHKKETFYTSGSLRSRTYYLNNKTGNEMLQNEKHKWSQEEKDAIKNADSVLFDYSNYWEPLIKIYVKD